MLVQKAVTVVEGFDGAEPQWIELPWMHVDADNFRVGGVAYYAILDESVTELLFLSAPLADGETESVLNRLRNHWNLSRVVAAIPSGVDVIEVLPTRSVTLSLTKVSGFSSKGHSGRALHLVLVLLAWCLALGGMILSLQWAQGLDDIDLKTLAVWETPLPLQDELAVGTRVLARHPRWPKRVCYATIESLNKAGNVSLIFLGETKVRKLSLALYEVFEDTVSRGAKGKVRVDGHYTHQAVILERTPTGLWWTIDGKSKGHQPFENFWFSYAQFAKGFPATVPSNLSTTPEKGRHVFARWKNKNWLWLAEVEKVTSAGIILKYFDGSNETLSMDHLYNANLDLGLRIQGYWTTDKKWYPGTIVDIGAKGVRIRYDDGDEAWHPLGGFRLPLQ